MRDRQAPATPAVEMLWETASADVVLHDRFGFAGAGEAAAWITGTVRSLWGIEVFSCARIVMSDSNALTWLETSAGRLVAKWSIATDRFVRLGALSTVLAELAHRDVPVSAPLTSCDGRRQVEVDGVSLALQREIPGQILDTADPAQVRAAGAQLAWLHRALAEITQDVPVLGSSDAVPSVRARIEEWLGGDRSHLPAPALRTLADSLDAEDDGLPVQLLHGDYRSTNILWSGNKVAAVLDFDEAKVDLRVDEIGRSAVLLGTRFTDWEPVTLAVREEFFRGYDAVNRPSDSERRWRRILVLWYSLATVPESDGRSSWSRAAAEELEAEHWRI